MNFVSLQEGSVIHASLTLHFVEISYYLSGEPLRGNCPGDLHLYSAAIRYIQVY